MPYSLISFWSNDERSKDPMKLPFVSRRKYEALEDKLEFAATQHNELKGLYEELKEHADKLLDSILKPTVAEPVEQDEPMKPRRPLGRDIVAMASADANRRYQEFVAWDAAQPKKPALKKAKKT